MRAFRTASAREQILQRSGQRQIEGILEREAANRARGAAAERAARVRALAIRGVSILARGGSAVVGFLWPSELENSELTPEQVRALEAKRYAEIERELRPITTTAKRLGGIGRDPSVLQPITTTARRLPGIRPRQTASPTTSPTAPAPTPTGTAPSARRSSLLRNLPWAQILLGALTGSAGSPRVSVNVAPTPAPTPAPGPSPQPLPLTVVGSGGVPFIPRSRTSTECECPPKRKKKRRKCLERAQVEWRTGRYKGKLAGSKCVRWSDI